MFFSSNHELSSIMDISDNETVIIPEGIVSISSQVMLQCCAENLTIVFPESLEVIKNYAFYNKKNITQLDFSKCKNLKEIGSRAFENVPIEYLDLSSSKNNVIVKAFAFNSNEKNGTLKNVNIDTVSVFEPFCFHNQRIKELSITNAQIIREHSFSDCLMLEKVKLSPYVTLIESCAFMNTSIKSVEIGPFTILNPHAFEDSVKVTNK